MKITAEEYLYRLKELKSYFKRCKKVVRNDTFWPHEKEGNLLHYFKLGKNVIGPLTLLQTTNLSLPNYRGMSGERGLVAPYRAFDPIDRAILGNHIVIAIDKRNGRVIVGHTYEDANFKTPIQPLNVAINELEQKLNDGTVTPDSAFTIGGECADPCRDWPVYRIVTYSNDAMVYPTVFMSKYGTSEAVYNSPSLNAYEILGILYELDRYISRIKADNDIPDTEDPDKEES